MEYRTLFLWAGFAVFVCGLFVGSSLFYRMIGRLNEERLRRGEAPVKGAMRRNASTFGYMKLYRQQFGSDSLYMSLQRSYWVSAFGAILVLGSLVMFSLRSR